MRGHLTGRMGVFGIGGISGAGYMKGMERCTGRMGRPSTAGAFMTANGKEWGLCATRGGSLFTRGNF